MRQAEFEQIDISSMNVWRRRYR